MVERLVVRVYLWAYIKQSTEYLRAQRTSVDDGCRFGLNFSITLAAACFVEGVLESSLLAILSHKAAALREIDIPDFEQRCRFNSFLNRRTDELESHISSSTGAQGYNEAFERILGERLSVLSRVQPLWESITVLFQFRNVLGHGRELRLSRSRGVNIPKPFEDDFSGGYKRLEDYLLKCGLATERAMDQWDSSQGSDESHPYLTDQIADHFWHIAQQLPAAIRDSLPDDIKQGLVTDWIAKGLFLT